MGYGLSSGIWVAGEWSCSNGIESWYQVRLALSFVYCYVVICYQCQVSPNFEATCYSR